MTRRSFPTVNIEKENPRKVLQVVRQLVLGKLNIVGDLTLSTTTAYTTVTNILCSPESYIGLMAKDANAASAAVHVTPGDQQFTINHANTTDSRTFRYIVVG